MKFNHFWLPQEKSTIAPWKKSFWHPCTQRLVNHGNW